MEAWKEELYHWGVKGMKWKKHKMSPLESAGRNAEQLYRTGQTNLPGYKKSWNRINTYDAFAKHRSALKDSGYGLLPYGRVKVKKSMYKEKGDGLQAWTGTKTAKAIARAEGRARVAAYNAAYKAKDTYNKKAKPKLRSAQSKAKKYISNLFKKKN